MFIRAALKRRAYTDFPGVNCLVAAPGRGALPSEPSEGASDSNPFSTTPCTMDNAEDLIDFLRALISQKADSLHLNIDSDGWTPIDPLIAAAQKLGVSLERPAIEAAMTQSPNRLAISDDGLFVRVLTHGQPEKPARAPSETPPDYLYHPTSTRLLGAVHSHGLRSQSNQLLHLFDDPDTANSLAPPLPERVIVTVQAGSMSERGFPFWRAENGVWLTEMVPPEFLL